MQYIVVGFLFILAKLMWPVESTESGLTYMIDIVPDFIGFVMIWLSLEKRAGLNKLFKHSLSFSAVMSVVSFMMFLCQIRFVINPLFEKIHEMYFLSGIISTLAGIFTTYGGIIDALVALFAALFATAMLTELNKGGHRVFAVMLRILSIVYVVIAVADVVSVWVKIPIVMASVTIPAGIAMLALCYFGLKNIKEFK